MGALFARNLLAGSTALLWRSTGSHQCRRYSNAGFCFDSAVAIGMPSFPSAAASPYSFTSPIRRDRHELVRLFVLDLNDLKPGAGCGRHPETGAAAERDLLSDNG